MPRRTFILLGVVVFAPLYRVACHFLGLHGKADETFPAVADILAIGCLLAIVAARVPKINRGAAVLMLVPVAFVPIYLGTLHFHLNALLLFVLWPLMHLAIAGLLLHVVRQPYGFLNSRPVVWLGKISYSLYLWQQLFVFGASPKPSYFVVFAVLIAGASYYLVEQPMLRLREKRASAQKVLPVYAEAA